MFCSLHIGQDYITAHRCCNPCMSLSIEHDPNKTKWTNKFVKSDIPADLKNIEETCYNPVRFQGKMFKSLQITLNISYVPVLALAKNFFPNSSCVKSYD